MEMAQLVRERLEFKSEPPGNRAWLSSSINAIQQMHSLERAEYFPRDKGGKPRNPLDDTVLSLPRPSPLEPTDPSLQSGDLGPRASLL